MFYTMGDSDQMTLNQPIIQGFLLSSLRVD